MKNIAIIGAGMSGLSAGIFLKNRNTNVDIYERQDKAGKKILLTGNGKCNITNKSMDESCYYTSKKSSAFIRDFITSFSYEDCLDFYKNIGVITKDKNGYYYPVSNQAATVLNSLLNENLRLGTGIKLNTYIDNIEIRNNAYYINNKFYDFIIFACGGMAGIYRENEFNGYKLLKHLNFTLNRSYPALTRVIADNNYPKTLSGLRLDCNINLVHKNQIIGSEYGELQFTDKGISGIPVFQLSLPLGQIIDDMNKNSVKNIPYFEIDTLPNYTYDELYKFLWDRLNKYPNLTIGNILEGFSNSKFNECLITKLNINDSTLAKDIDELNVQKLTGLYKSFKIYISKLDSFKNAQVSSGGVSLDEITNSFESNKYNNMFILGEMLDCTGKCGGYNLNFALGSAYLASKEILKRL